MKSGQQTTEVTNALDPQTQAFIEAFRRQAQGGLGTGAIGDAQNAFNSLINPNAAQSGALRAGQGLLGFLPQAGQGLDISQFFNPFQDEVIGGLQSDFDRQRGLVDRSARDAATAAGAFGGSREAILRSEGARNVGDIEARTLADVRRGGFSEATRNALGFRGQNVGLGLAGLGQLNQSAQLSKFLEQARAAGISNIPGLLSQLFSTGFTPGSTTATQTTEMPSDLFGNLLGTGATIGGLLLAGPAGAAVGSQFGNAFTSGGSQALDPSVIPTSFGGFGFGGTSPFGGGP